MELNFFFFKYKKSRGRFSFIVDELKDRVVMSITRVPFSRKGVWRNKYLANSVMRGRERIWQCY